MQDRPSVRIAAAGDIHCRAAIRREIADAFQEVDGHVDLILLAGDLTTHGEPEQAAVIAVLGNHDWQADRRDELVAVLAEAGVRVLDRAHAINDVRGCEVGVVGVKGFVGGFPGSHLSDFGEPSLRALYAETGAEVEALDRGLRAIAMCPFRIALLHYSPSEETLLGEPQPIWTYLGSDRLAAPVREHEPDLVLHGHAHAGSFAGAIDGVPVHNVSGAVM